MRNHSSPRRSGSALFLLLLVMIILLMGLASMLSMASLSSMRTVAVSEDWMRAYYVADSGAQSGIARIRASNGTLFPVAYTERVAKGTAAVDIQVPSPGLYRIVSTGRYENETEQVEVHVRHRPFELPGLLTMNFSRGTMVTGTSVKVFSGGSSQMNGMDHAPDGSLLVDQTHATYALAMNAIPGNTDFGIEYEVGGSSTIKGYPEVSMNTAESQDAVLQGLLDRAANQADVSVVGAKSLNDGDTGRYGTELSPKLVYARLKDGQTLNMTNSFSGWGTLVIDVEKATKSTVLKMTGSATWHGVVLLYFRDKADIVQGSLIEMVGSSRIIGGTAVFFNNNNTVLAGKGSIFKIGGGAQLLYSHQLIHTAPGTAGLGGQGAEVTAYRTL